MVDVSTSPDASMNEADIRWAMQAGAPVTCGTCRHFHEGNMHCAQPECGGPGSGRDFPIYDGPIPRSKFIERCLVCGGDRVEFHIIMGEDKTKFALCKKHRNTYSHVGAPEGKIRHPVKLIAIP